jgi:hypothetical protein
MIIRTAAWVRISWVQWIPLFIELDNTYRNRNRNSNLSCETGGIANIFMHGGTLPIHHFGHSKVL